MSEYEHQQVKTTTEENKSCYNEKTWILNVYLHYVDEPKFTFTVHSHVVMNESKFV